MHPIQEGRVPPGKAAGTAPKAAAAAARAEKKKPLSRWVPEGSSAGDQVRHRDWAGTFPIRHSIHYSPPEGARAGTGNALDGPPAKG